MIMGGEPTIHPDFEKMIIEATKYYQNIELFTNGTKINEVISIPNIINLHWQNRFQFIVNGYQFDPTKTENFDVNKFSSIILFYVIPFDEEENNKIIEKIIKIAKFNPKFIFAISLDTSINILDEEIAKTYRKRYVNFLKNTFPFIYNRANVDHPIPHCFFTQEIISDLYEIGIGPIHLLNKYRPCCDQNIGLVNTDWSLEYCNQTRINLGNIKGKTIPEITKMLQLAPKMKYELVKTISEKCANCPAFSTCKAKCWCGQLQQMEKKL